MKITNIKLVSITAFVFSSLLMGCSEEVYDGAYKPSLESHYLSVYPRDFEFGDGEETKTGYITSENSWLFTDIPHWLSITPTSGNSDTDFSILSKKNESVSNREAVFYVSANNATSKIKRTLTASQTGANAYISFPEYSSSKITIEGKSDYLIIDISSNIPDLTATFSQSWASASYYPKSKTVDVEIQANETNSSRSGTLTVSSSQYGKTAKLTITQLVPDVTVLEGIALSYDADGGSQTRTIQSDLPWTAASTCPWIEFYPTSGEAGETRMTIWALPSYETDNRIGQIYFYFGDTEKKYIGITQTGRYLTTTPNKITLSADENSSEKVVIDSNIGWELSTCPEWLTLSQNNGNAGNTSITITALKNNSLNSRSGTIILKDSQTGVITSSITVSQNGLDFGDDTTLEFGWQASSQKLTVPIPNKWNAAVSDGWITLSQYTGTGETTCDITVSRNDSQETRTGQIIFSSEGQNITVSVVQEGQYINIDATTGEIPAMGGSVELYVNSTVDVSPSIEYNDGVEDWVAYEKIAENTYNLSVEYNPSINQRSATFILKPQNSDVQNELASGVKYIIKQFGRDLRVEPSKIYLFAKGGSSETYSIVADGEYTIIKPEEFTWFTLIHNSENDTYYIVSTENKSDSPRTGYITASLKNLPEGESRDVRIGIFQNSIYDTEIIYSEFDNEDKPL